MPTATTGILRMLRDRVAPVWTVVADIFFLVDLVRPGPPEACCIAEKF